MASIAQAWRAFRQDEPGERFENHYRRMRQDRSRAGAIARLAIGVALTLGGIALLFLPGPGILVVLFGLGLLGGESKVLARALDRGEPVLRRRGNAAKRAWRRAGWPARAGVIGGCAAAAGTVAYLAVRIVT